MKIKRPNTAALQRTVDAWNAKHPIGTAIMFHPVIGAAPYRTRTTRTAAQVLSEHTAVVWLDGESGCVALDACVPVIEEVV